MGFYVDGMQKGRHYDKRDQNVEERRQRKAKTLLMRVPAGSKGNGE
jgi:hypothetical protein